MLRISGITEEAEIVIRITSVLAAADTPRGLIQQEIPIGARIFLRCRRQIRGLSLRILHFDAESIGSLTLSCYLDEWTEWLLNVSSSFVQ